MSYKNNWKNYLTNYVFKEDILNFKREIEDDDMLYDNNIFIMSKEPTSTKCIKLSKKQLESYYHQYVNKVTHNKYINHGWFRYAGSKNKKKSEKILKKYYKYIKIEKEDRDYVNVNCEDWDDKVLYLREYQAANGATLLNIFDDDDSNDDY